jgi:hypothetical protein
MNLSAAQLESNYLKLVDIVENKISGPRKKAMLDLYDEWSVRMALAPASTKKQYHNAFPGGYVLHVLNVVAAAEKLCDLWESMGAVLDFRQEEMYFSAINHDLGKIGTDFFDYYVPCREDWMVKKGSMYMLNPDIPYMKVSERSLMILGSKGISISEKEYLAIKLHDGLYEDSNKPYLMSYNDDQALKTYLPHIIHQADFISAKLENTFEVVAAPTVPKVPNVSNKPSKASNNSSSLERFLNE